MDDQREQFEAWFLSPESESVRMKYVDTGSVTDFACDCWQAGWQTATSVMQAEFEERCKELTRTEELAAKQVAAMQAENERLKTELATERETAKRLMLHKAPITPQQILSLRDGEEISRLRAIVAKLPTTKDGVPIVPKMTVWWTEPRNPPNFPAIVVSGSVQSITEWGTVYFPTNTARGFCSGSDVYSTREAAEAAKAEEQQEADWIAMEDSESAKANESVTEAFVRESVHEAVESMPWKVESVKSDIPRHMEVGPNGSQRCTHCGQWIFTYPCNHCGQEPFNAAKVSEPNP